jgi:hypothetical protein
MSEHSNPKQEATVAHAVVTTADRWRLSPARLPASVGRGHQFYEVTLRYAHLAPAHTVEVQRLRRSDAAMPTDATRPGRAAGW